ncbi:MAG: hypothetical protein SFW64_09355 [Alphaproteobacteria bacterium]|nr:hypothetical protein [Alphaproteobacteria bacterium]
MSDLAILLGIEGGYDKTDDGQQTGCFWTRGTYDEGDVLVIDADGRMSTRALRSRDVGVRPALSPLATSAIDPDETKSAQKFFGMDVVEYGEYPQTLAGADLSPRGAAKFRDELEEAFSRNQLQKTRKTYTFDGEERTAYSKPFCAKECAEYEYKGKRYIRIDARRDSYFVLSNGEKPQAGKPYWVEVQPLEWLVEPDKITIDGQVKDNPYAGWWVAKRILAAGVPFNRGTSYNHDFENMDIKKQYLRLLAKEMQVLARNLSAGTIADHEFIIGSFLLKEDLFKKDAQGGVPFDDPRTWDRIDEIIETLARNGDPLVESDLERTDSLGRTYRNRVPEAVLDRIRAQTPLSEEECARRREEMMPFRRKIDEMREALGAYDSFYDSLLSDSNRPPETCKPWYDRNLVPKIPELITLAPDIQAILKPTEIPLSILPTGEKSKCTPSEVGDVRVNGSMAIHSDAKNGTTVRPEAEGPRTTVGTDTSEHNGRTYDPARYNMNGV